MKIYRVGGSIRDELLNQPVIDRDYVVVGATPESMIAQGYRPVGRDFPVFLHPETHEEYALARTERKSGRGHQGFVFHADASVTLDEDLLRRDLTINAMARDEEDESALIDPYGGQQDLATRTLRHVSPAFGEDPLRVLRVARFAARFGFDVAEETEALMRQIVVRGELADLSPERVWREFSLGLTASAPSRMLAALRRCGALSAVAPELDQLFAMPASGRQPDLGILTSMALDHGAAADAPQSLRLPIQFGIAARYLAVDDARSLSARLKVGNDCRDAATLAPQFVGMLEGARSMTGEQWLQLLAGTDAQRRPERIDILAAIGVAHAAARQAVVTLRGAPEDAPEDAQILGAGVASEMTELPRAALSALSQVDYRGIGAGIGAGIGVADRARALRLRALDEWVTSRDQIR